MILRTKRGRDRCPIVGRGTGAVRQRCEGAQMGVGQVGDMDIVTDAGPVGGRVVGAVNRDQCLGVLRRPQQERDQVGLGGVVFADLPVRVRPGGVEIAQGVTSSVMVVTILR